MNAISIDTLKLRVPPLEYQSPPVCEVILSGSGYPSIDLSAFGDLGKPGPIQPPDYPDDPVFKFPPTDPVPLCVSIAKDNGSGVFVVVEVCVPVRPCHSGLLCVPPPPEEGCFKIQVITEIGTTPWSDPVCIVAPAVQTLPATDVT